MLGAVCLTLYEGVPGLHFASLLYPSMLHTLPQHSIAVVGLGFGFGFWLFVWGNRHIAVGSLSVFQSI